MNNQSLLAHNVSLSNEGMILVHLLSLRKKKPLTLSHRHRLKIFDCEVLLRDRSIIMLVEKYCVCCPCIGLGVRCHNREQARERKISPDCGFCSDPSP